MSLFSKKKQAVRNGPRTLSYSRSFDSGQAVKVRGEAMSRFSPALNEESDQAEYEVPASGWTDPGLPRTQGVLIEGEYEVSPSGWPREALADTYSVERVEEYEVVGEALRDYAEPYSRFSAGDDRQEEYTVRSSPADETERGSVNTSASGVSPAGETRLHIKEREDRTGDPSASGSGGKKKAPQDDAIDEAMVADDIRSIMMGDAKPAKTMEPPRPEPAAPAPQSQPEGLDESLLSQAPENVRKKMENEHAIFDRIAQSMKYANAYDLGSIAMEQRFDAFDEAEDNKPVPPVLTGTTGGKAAPQPPKGANDDREQLDSHAQQQDFIEDLDLIKHVVAQSNNERIPLDPGVGGRSIGESALEPGDIILSTTTADISKLIRGATDSEVSHSSIYIGNGKVVEAVDSGVILRSLDTALNEDTLAVAYRHRDMTSEKAETVVNYLQQQAKDGRKFDNWGLVRAAPGQLARAVCNRLDGALRDACLAGAKELKVGTDDQNAFYCSELVFSALKAADLSITDIHPSWSSPEQIVTLHLKGLLDYVGHLKV